MSHRPVPAPGRGERNGEHPEASVTCFLNGVLPFRLYIDFYPPCREKAQSLKNSFHVCLLLCFRVSYFHVAPNPVRHLAVYLGTKLIFKSTRFIVYRTSAALIGRRGVTFI